MVWYIHNVFWSIFIWEIHLLVVQHRIYFFAYYMVCGFWLLVSNERISKRTHRPYSLSIRSKERMFQPQSLLVLAKLWRILSPSNFVFLLLLAGIRSFKLLGFRIDSTWSCSHGRQPDGDRTNEQIPFDWHDFTHS